MKTPVLALSSLLLTASALSAQDVGPVFDGFTGGVNQGGWIYNGSETFPPTEGNPGAWMHQSFASTFAPVFVTQTSVYDGDYRAAGVSRLTFDARLVSKNFGDGSGFSMSILLRDTKDTADVTDDDYAYFVGENVPIQGTGWKSFDFGDPERGHLRGSHRLDPAAGSVTAARSVRASTGTT